MWILHAPIGDLGARVEARVGKPCRGICVRIRLGPTGEVTGTASPSISGACDVLAEDGCGGSMIVVGTVRVSLEMPMMMVVCNTRSSSWRLKNTLLVQGHHQCFGWSVSLFQLGY